MLKRFLSHLILGILAIYLATVFVPGVIIKGISEEFIRTLILAGATLGLANFFLKPIINLISFPLRILTLGFFSLIVNMLMVWLVNILFLGLIIPGLMPLFWTGLLSWFLNLVVLKKK